MASSEWQIANSLEGRAYAQPQISVRQITHYALRIKIIFPESSAPTLPKNFCFSQPLIAIVFLRFTHYASRTGGR